MWIPATPRRNPTNPDKIPTQPSKKYCKILQESGPKNRKALWKILSKSGPGGSPEPPESLRDPSGTHRSEENASKRFPAAKKLGNPSLGTGFGTILGPGRDPKIDKKRARERKSASGDGAGSDFCRFFLPVPFGVALWTNFWRV